MTFIDGILNGIRSAAGLDGIEQSKKNAPKDSAETPAKSGHVATKVETQYDPEPAAPKRAKPDLGSLAREALTEAPATTPPHEAATSSTVTPPTTVARATVRDVSRGFAVLGDATTLTGSDDASVAARNVQGGLDYYAQTFGRDGIDGRGTGVDVDINDRTTDANGAQTFRGNGGYYATPQADGSIYEAIHYGDGNSYTAAKGTVAQASMLHADDLAVHELTHGIIRKETGYLGGGADEAGATNEAIADVMGASATRDWTLGEGMYGAGSDYKNMRNIANPDDPTSVHGLYTSMDQVRAARAQTGEAEEHWAAGVISTAAYRVQQRLGGEAGWNAVEQVFYNVIDAGRLGDMSFDTIASGVRSAANELYGPGSEVAAAFDQELAAAGL